MQDYLDKIKPISDATARAMFVQFRIQKNILGSEVVIERLGNTGNKPTNPSDEGDVMSGSMSYVWGSGAAVTDPLNPNITRIPHRLIINKNFFSNILFKQQQPFAIYDNENVLKLGDQFTVRSGKVLYRFKVNEVHSYGLDPHIMWRYDIIGMNEEYIETDSIEIDPNKDGEGDDDFFCVI